MRTLIENLQFALTVDEDNTRIDGASLLVEDDRIAAIGTTDDISRRIAGTQIDAKISGRRLGVVPGFVDTHVHVVESLSKASFPDCLETRAWVFHWAKPFYAHLSEEDEYVSACMAFQEMLSSGTTAFLDMGAQNDPGVIVKAAIEAGLRGVTGRFAADRKPERVPRGWTEEMVEHHFFPNAQVALEVLEQCVLDWDGKADGRVRCWVNIEGKEPCSPELHLGARELAERLGVGTSYHIASSLKEAELSEARYGAWPIKRIADLGGLGPNLVLAHATATRQNEVGLLADAGTKVAFCPGSSFKLAKGATQIGKYPEMREAGVTVGLGTDGVSAAGSFNLMRQMYLAAGMFKDARIDAFQIGGEQALRMATIDGARTLGWETEIGSLEEGKKADFVLFDLDHIEWVPFADPLQALVWSASSASIAETWVDGRGLYRDGKVQTIDVPALYEEARARASDIAQRAGLNDKGIPVVTDMY